MNIVPFFGGPISVYTVSKMTITSHNIKLKINFIFERYNNNKNYFFKNTPHEQILRQFVLLTNITAIFNVSEDPVTSVKMIINFIYSWNEYKLFQEFPVFQLRTLTNS